MVDPLRKDALSAELAAARDRLGSHALGLRRTLSPAEAVKRGVHHHPAAWFGGAVILGLALSLLPARSKKVKVEPRLKGDRKEAASQAGKAALAVTVLKFALDLAKPSLMRLVRERFSAAMAARQRPHGAQVPPPPYSGSINLPPRQTVMDVQSPVP
jgi:hypothetical protein